LVTFTPRDSEGYTTAQAAVLLTVEKATPAIAWPAPASITDATPLSATQLNAEASVPGTFVYSPAASHALAEGTHTLSVIFTPADTGNYTTAQATVQLTVTKTMPTVLKWPIPSAISYGAALSADQLNAEASVPGTFVYTPGAGNVLTAGRHRLSVTFIPADTVNHATAHAAVSLAVEELPNIASLLAAVTQMPSKPVDATEVPDYSDFVDAKWREVQSESTHHYQQDERETRTYKGATYEKGEDGQWHLQQR